MLSTISIGDRSFPLQPLKLENKYGIVIFRSALCG